MDPKKPMFSFDFLENSDDAIIFESQPMTEDVEVFGQPKARLFIKSDAKDTDFIIHLCKVDSEDNTVMMAGEVLDGMRTRYRNSNSKTELMNP